MKKEHIENHFITNPYWKQLFLKHFPDWTPETWTEDAWSIFVKNGYKCEIEMMGIDNAVKEITLYDTKVIDENNDGWITGIRWVTKDVAVEQLLIHVICDFMVNFTKFE